MGAAIRRRRQGLGLTRRDLERRSDISYPYLSEIEAGKKSPSAAMLERIGAVLDVSPSELMAAAEQTLEQATPAPAAPAPAAAPPPMSVTAASAPAHFHRSQQAKVDPAASSRAPDVEEEPLIELLRIAKSLPGRDLRLLLDLARRLVG